MSDDDDDDDDDDDHLQKLSVASTIRFDVGIRNPYILFS